jgi:hypothetical protein
MKTDSSFSISRYIFTNSTTASTTITQFYAAGNWIYAPGVAVRRASDDPAWPISGSTTSTTSTTSMTTIIGLQKPSSDTDEISSLASSSSSMQTGTNNNTTAVDTGPYTDTGLSTGAKIGIGVSVALGALLIIGIIVAAVIISKQKRRAAQAVQAAAPYRPASPSTDLREWENKVYYENMPPSELGDYRRPYELHAQQVEREPAELMSH